MEKTNFSSLGAFLRDALIIAAGVFIAAIVVSGIPQSLLVIFLAACMISFLNAFVRPLMIAKVLPFVIGLALGGGVFNMRALAGKIFWLVIIALLALWLINGFIFWIAFFVIGAKIAFGTALWGSVWTSLATLFICAFFGIKRQNLTNMIFQQMAGTSEQMPNESKAGTKKSRAKDDDVIDI